MKLLYSLIIRIYLLGISMAQFFIPKAKNWIEGRQNQKEVWNKLQITSQPIWFHCSSLGEFEQARPLIEKIKETTDEKILLTFFSPSGYKVRYHYEQADYIFYLPMDTSSNVTQWLNVFQPKMLILTKYDFWWNYIDGCIQRSVPILLISAVFRKPHYLFRPYGRYFLKKIEKFECIFVQDNRSQDLLHKYGILSTLAGDTRVDRVLSIRENPKVIPFLDDFSRDHRVIVLGSSWSEEESIVASWYHNEERGNIKLIIAPHDISPAHIEKIRSRFDQKAILWSDSNKNSNAQILVVNSIGLLSSIYRYAWIAVVGGGFKQGIHNILEPLAFEVPVIVGPNYSNFPEAVELVKLRAVRSIDDLSGLAQVIREWDGKNRYAIIQENIRSYFAQHKGATQTIFRYLQTKW